MNHARKYYCYCISSFVNYPGLGIFKLKIGLFLIQRCYLLFHLFLGEEANISLLNMSFDIT